MNAEKRRELAKVRVETVRVSKHGKKGQPGYTLLHPGRNSSEALKKMPSTIQWDLKKFGKEVLQNAYVGKDPHSKKGKYEIISSPGDTWNVLHDNKVIATKIDSPEHAADKAQEHANERGGVSAVSVATLAEAEKQHPDMNGDALVENFGEFKLSGDSAVDNAGKEAQNSPVSVSVPKVKTERPNNALTFTSKDLGSGVEQWSAPDPNGGDKYSALVTDLPKGDSTVGAAPGTWFANMSHGSGYHKEIYGPTKQDVLDQIQATGEAWHKADSVYPDGMPKKFAGMKVTKSPYSSYGKEYYLHSNASEGVLYTLKYDGNNVDVSYPDGQQFDSTGEPHTGYFVNLNAAEKYLRGVDEEAVKKEAEKWNVTSEQPTSLSGNKLYVGPRASALQVVENKQWNGSGYKIYNENGIQIGAYEGYPTAQIAVDVANKHFYETANPDKSLTWNYPGKDSMFQDDSGNWKNGDYSVWTAQTLNGRYQVTTKEVQSTNGLKKVYQLDQPNLNGKLGTHDAMTQFDTPEQAMQVALNWNNRVIPAVAADRHMRNFDSAVAEKDGSVKSYVIEGTAMMTYVEDSGKNPATDGKWMVFSMHNDFKGAAHGEALQYFDTRKEATDFINNTIQDIKPDVVNPSVWKNANGELKGKWKNSAWTHTTPEGNTYTLRSQDYGNNAYGWALYDSDSNIIDLSKGGDFPEYGRTTTLKEARLGAENYFNNTLAAENAKFEEWRQLVSTISVPDNGIASKFVDIGHNDPTLEIIGEVDLPEAMDFLKNFDDLDLDRHRGKIKDKLVKRLSALFDEELSNNPQAKEQFQNHRDYNSERGSYDYVNELVAMWAGTSGDHDDRAIALQLMAADEFKMEQRHVDGLDQGTVERARGDVIPEEGEAMRAFIRASYRNTQAELISRGVPEQIVLYRGMRFTDNETVPDWVKRGAVSGKKRRFTNTLMNPLTSWSANRNTSDSFAGSGSYDDYSVLMAAVIPRESIYGTARTGQGCANEYEFVVAGGHGTTYADIRGTAVIHPPATYTPMEQDLWAQFVAEHDGMRPTAAQMSDLMRENGFEFSNPYVPMKGNVTQDQLQSQLENLQSYTGYPSESELSLSDMAKIHDFKHDYPGNYNYADYFALKEIGKSDLAEKLPNWQKPPTAEPKSAAELGIETPGLTNIAGIPSAPTVNAAGYYTGDIKATDNPENMGVTKLSSWITQYRPELPFGSPEIADLHNSMQQPYENFNSAMEGVRITRYQTLGLDMGWGDSLHEISFHLGNMNEAKFINWYRENHPNTKLSDTEIGEVQYSMAHGDLITVAVDKVAGDQTI